MTIWPVGTTVLWHSSCNLSYEVEVVAGPYDTPDGAVYTCRTGNGAVMTFKAGVEIFPLGTPRKGELERAVIEAAKERYVAEFWNGGPRMDKAIEAEADAVRELLEADCKMPKRTFGDHDEISEQPERFDTANTL